MRLSYYYVKTRLVDIVELCWLKKKIVEQICQVLIVDLDYLFSWALLVETKLITTNMLL